MLVGQRTLHVVEQLGRGRIGARGDVCDPSKAWARPGQPGAMQRISSASTRCHTAASAYRRAPVSPELVPDAQLCAHLQRQLGLEPYASRRIVRALRKVEYVSDALTRPEFLTQRLQPLLELQARVPGFELRTALVRSPCMLTQHPDTVSQRLSDNAAALGLAITDPAFTRALRRTSALLTRSPRSVQRIVDVIASFVGVEDALRAALAFPQVFSLSPDSVHTALASLQESFGLDSQGLARFIRADVCALSLSRSLPQRLDALCEVLQMPPPEVWTAPPSAPTCWQPRTFLD